MSTSLTSQLTQSLRDELLNGTFRPGQQLRLNQLSQQFNVSLSPLREALSRLAAEGLVIAQDQRGYQAAPVSVRNHQEITELRTMLEPHALRISMQQGGEDWEVAVLAAHHRLQQVEKRAASDPGALAEWEIRHREFHLMLIGGGQMPVLAQFCEKLLAFSDRYRRIFLRERPLDRDIPDEHEAILRATLDRDEARASELLAQHIGRTAANIAILLEQWESGAGDAAA
ncbi:GntR family transcriptional regulator [Pigmentiphaga sp. GD03639]|uniref:GntR family transcriptional regulator n=1 Tax=Pigmentiphaga sp. GD03639 TaxID=2975354 RepID=UPI0024481C99|nr:GntR family transcriptional regulator [Pigmentiphaga sp. GD03639]MDH2234736.1 GntR family transcriptional regulator [Pigmentiphaga sp. GD03639]